MFALQIKKSNISLRRDLYNAAFHLEKKNIYLRIKPRVLSNMKSREQTAKKKKKINKYFQNAFTVHSKVLF